MAASFPGTLWTWTDQVDNTSAMDAADVNAPAAEIIAMQSHLGAGSIAAGQIILNSAAGVDPWVSLQINSVEKFRIGVDDSDSDKLKINTGALADPSLWEVSSTGHIELTNVAETASDPGRHLYLQRTHTGAVGSGKGLTGIEVRSTFNGSAAAATSEVKGGEFKARHTTGNTYTVGTFKGVIGNVDVKNGTVTTGWAVEGAIDVSSGGTFTTAACFHGNLNNSGTVTNSYGVYVHGLSGNVLTRGLYVDYATTGIYLDNCTTDIRFQNGATIVNSTSDLLTITEATIATVGKLQFGGATDWGAGATGTLIDGSGYDWVSQTVGHVDSGTLAAACAAGYHALTVTPASHTTASSFFGTWTELYIQATQDLTNTANCAAVWGQIEMGASVETTATATCFMAGGYFNIKTGTSFTSNSGIAVNGVRVQSEVASGSITHNGRLAAFECLTKSGSYQDWDYGLYVEGCATGVNITACTTAAINIETAQVTGINIAGAMTTAGINIVGGTAAGAALLIGTDTTGVKVDGTPAYVTRMYADVITGSYTNIGCLRTMTTLASNAVITSNSFTTASYNRLEMDGGATLSGWVVSVLGYLKNTSGTVNASAAIVAPIVGLINLGSGYTDPAGWTAAFIAGTYGNAGAITDFTGYLVMDQAQDNFDNGFMCADNAATTGLKIGICTTGIYLAGAMTTGISVANNLVIPQLIAVGASGNGIHWAGAAENIMIYAEKTATAAGTKTFAKMQLQASQSGAVTSGRLECFRGEVVSYSTSNITADIRGVVGQISLGAITFASPTGYDFSGAFGVIGSIYNGAQNLDADSNLYPVGSFFGIETGSTTDGEASMYYMYCYGKIAPDSCMRLYNATGQPIAYFLENPNSAPLGNPGSMPFSDDVVDMTGNSTGSIKVRLGGTTYRIPIVAE